MEEANLESFLEWGAAIGISDTPISDNPSSSSCLGHSLSVSHFPEAGGRGLAAARDLRKGELVLRVPKAALITSDRLINDDPILSSALVNYPSLSSNQILSVALLNEANKGRSSSWYTYLKQLPRSYDLLASFDRFEIEALQIDDAIWTAEKAVHKEEKEWEEATPLMCELNFKNRLTTFKAWLWASATVSASLVCFHYPCLGDFVNYAPPQENLDNLKEDDLLDGNTDRLTDPGFDEAVASYCFYAKKNYVKGDQVLLSYGTYTNLELLEYYGFLLQENPNDKAFIPLESEMYSLCSWPRDSLYISKNGKPSFALISTVRLWATPERNRRSVKHIAFSGQLISNENEVAAMEWIANKCRDLLTGFPSSIEEDALVLCMIDEIENCSGDRELAIRTLLERNSVKATRSDICRLKLAVEWRHRYKNILSDCILYCSCTRMLDNPSC
ncbi:PREDICTED: protein SET DOMAIN GROUP 40 [Erythranthe guttata]|nr:PREDICTED: protein SET DOMAIN GROUP 40 [Erythranthe guttata]|eukprot:XP_012841547.1 PREDICTED: protein SET DOMAIN GROUP 40 [Erythranthe guttata]